MAALFVAAGVVAGGVTWWATAKERNTPVVHVEVAEAGYSTWAEALAASDAVLVGSITSDPVSYVTYYGKGGKPQYEGDSGVMTTIVTLRVDRVVRGDASMLRAVIPLVVPSPQESDLPTLTRDADYLVVVAEHAAAAGVTSGGGPERTWALVSPSQGIFGVDDSGRVMPLVDGVWPELFGRNGSTAVSLETLPVK